jgi:hypothetical protein
VRDAAVRAPSGDHVLVRSAITATVSSPSSVPADLIGADPRGAGGSGAPASFRKPARCAEATKNAE